MFGCILFLIILSTEANKSQATSETILPLLCSFPKHGVWVRKSSYSLYISNHIPLLRGVIVATFVEIFDLPRHRTKSDMHEMVSRQTEYEDCCLMRTKGWVASFPQDLCWNYSGLLSKNIDRKKKNIHASFFYREVSCMVGFLFKRWWLTNRKINLNVQMMQLHKKVSIFNRSLWHWSFRREEYRHKPYSCNQVTCDNRFLFEAQFCIATATHN